MKKITALLATIFLFRILFVTTVSASPENSAKSAVVIDAESGKI